MSTEGFIKADQGKLRWSLMPWTQLKEVVKVLMIGAAKYSDDNWHQASDADIKRYKDALSRHIVDWLAGEKNDPETGLSHLAHAVCNCLFLMYYETRLDTIKIACDQEYARYKDHYGL
jgi:hypothetical protein